MQQTVIIGAKLIVEWEAGLPQCLEAGLSGEDEAMVDIFSEKHSFQNRVYIYFDAWLPDYVGGRDF